MVAVSEKRAVSRAAGARAALRNNGLSLVTFGLFLLFLTGQTLTGHRHFNDQQLEHGDSPVPLLAYLRSGHYLEATAENWESEFLQMAMYVVLTAMLFQKGSSESKKLDNREAVNSHARPSRIGHEAPWPVRRGGWILKLYENSLSLVFLLLFLVSFALHAIGGTAAYNEEQLQHGGEVVSVLEYLETSQFWFESFQNWQSEFLSLVAMVVLSIFLRQRGSPESKPVDAPHNQTA